MFPTYRRKSECHVRLQPRELHFAFQLIDLARGIPQRQQELSREFVPSCLEFALRECPANLCPIRKAITRGAVPGISAAYEAINLNGCQLFSKAKVVYVSSRTRSNLHADQRHLKRAGQRRNGTPILILSSSPSLIGGFHDQTRRCGYPVSSIFFNTFEK